MSARLLRRAADLCYAVGRTVYDFGLRLDRYAYGVPWKDTK